ncbi:MAG: Ppx/GppA phosphatase family protein [Actinomycetota bacterium]
MTGLRLAAIDVGTNTTRLLAVEVAPPGPLGGAPGCGGPVRLTELERQLMFTRLGQGIDASGSLLAASIERTVGAIRAFAQRCAELEVARIRIAGTSAVREATNRADLLTAVRDSVGLPLEVVPGEQEAALSFAGATADLGAGHYLVLDIGGGSTELALGTTLAGRSPAGSGAGGSPAGSGAGAPAGRRGPMLTASASLRLGVVRLTERHMAADPATPGELAALEADVDRALEADLAPESFSQAGSATLVGVAGTVTSLAAISLGLVEYHPKRVHGTWLSRAEVERLYRELATMALAERERLAPLPPGRADVIVAGCGILSRVLARWSFGGLRVSERDILDGLVQSLVEVSVAN